MTDIETPSELVNRLHSVRVSKGLTIQQMAAKCGIPKSSLESYMKMTGAKRPGIDALIAIADGMTVSLDWLVGRAVDSHSTKLSQKDYAMACFSVVSSLIIWMRQEQASSPETIFSKDSIAGKSDAEIAAKSMLLFVERVGLFDDTAHAAGLDRGDLFDRLFALLKQEQPATK
jgi:transcriptional regulator with XRE-family HTH domain